MNRGRRQELKQLKYKRRLRNLRLLNASSLRRPKGVGESGVPYNLCGYKNHGSPCSCQVCSHKKYDRAKIRNGKSVRQIYGEWDRFC